VAEGLARLAFAAVAVLLLASLAQQFRTLGPRSRWLDALALVPQWKFFGQSAVGFDPAWSDDWHVRARVSTADCNEPPGLWREVLGPDERAWWHFAWNPRRRSQAQLLAYAEQLAQAKSSSAVEPTALAYLAVLRVCFAKIPLGEDEVLQFSVVATRGRGERPLSLHYLSHWHVP